MSIDRTKPILPGNAQHDLALRPKNQSTGTITRSSEDITGTQVSISKQVKAIQADTTQDINLERLASIRSAIDAGELHIDTDKIAHALLQDMLNF